MRKAIILSAALTLAVVSLLPADLPVQEIVDYSTVGLTSDGQ